MVFLVVDRSGPWRRAVSSLKDIELRAAFVRSEILRAAPADVAAVLDALCEAAEQADPIARDVLGAAVPVLVDPDLAPLVDELRAIAAARALLPLARLLRRRNQPGEPPPGPEEPKLATASSGRVLTLGERRALARRPSRASFDALMRDPHPMVIRNLLANPRMTEDDVIRMAARRPAYPEVIVEIARHPRWSQRARVRMAIVQNPYTPQAIAVPMVRLLIRPELREVVAAADVSPVVRAAATELLERRPPVPEKAGNPPAQ
jgi:hypothetical protein